MIDVAETVAVFMNLSSLNEEDTPMAWVQKRRKDMGAGGV